MGPPVSHVTFFNQRRSVGAPRESRHVFIHGGRLGPRVSNVTFFNHGGRLVSMIFHGSFMVFHGFLLVSMVFQGSFMVSHGF